MMKEKEVAMTVSELEVVMERLQKDLGLNINIPNVIARVQAGEQAPYHLTNLRIVVREGKPKTERQLSMATRSIKTWLMLGQATVLRYIMPDSEIVLRRYL